MHILFSHLSVKLIYVLKKLWFLRSRLELRLMQHCLWWAHRATPSSVLCVGGPGGGAGGPAGPTGHELSGPQVTLRMCVFMSLWLI